MDLGDAITELETFVWNLTGHSPVTTRWNITKLGKRTNFYVPFQAMELISSYDTIWTMCPFMNFGSGNYIVFSFDIFPSSASLLTWSTSV